MGLAQVSSGLVVCAVVENTGSRTAQLGFPLEPCPFPVGQQSCTEQMKESVLCQTSLETFPVSVAVPASMVFISAIPHLMIETVQALPGLR